MTPLDALLELLERAGASRRGAALVSGEELSGWPADAVRELKSQKLLLKASPPISVVCPGCEQECTMPVHTLPAGTGPLAAFVICDKRSDINRVPVSAKRLRQWRCSAEAVGAFVTRNLRLRPDSQRKTDVALWELGLVRGKKRSQMVCLRANGQFELMAGNNAVLLAELVRHGPEGYAVDAEAARRLVDASTTVDSRHTPSNARREARKLDTQALHESWRKAYRALKKSRPEMSDVWHAQQIAKKDIGKGRSAETIRKHVKR